GLFTNIGGVLEKASYGWSRPDSSEKRSMILLTDGMVDISKDASVNARERDKILTQILPKLKQSGVSIHTIALSQNADHELLKALSTQTDGWYQAVDSAEELQKVFLKIFEQSTERDSLPLTDNQFKVDASIEEMTLLVFKQDPLEESKLITPDNQIIQSSTNNKSVRWFTTAGYDLITVKSPQSGDWKIDAKVDPDNRVMVVSKLGLSIGKVPNNLLAGEAINYEATLLEDGEVITKPDFLSLVEAKLIQNKDGQTSRLAMFFDSGSHKFKQNFFTDSFEGVLDLTLEVKSPTFERTRNHAINIYGSPLIHEVEISEVDDLPHQLSFSVRDDIVKPESLKVNLTIQHPDGEKQYLGVDDLAMPVSIRRLPEGGKYQISVDVKGESILGRNFSVSPAPVIFEAQPTAQYLASQQQEKVEEPIKEEPAEQEPEDVVEKKEESKPESEEEKPEIAEQPETEATDWTLWLYIGLAANLLLAVLGFFGWKLIKKKGRQSSALMADELAIDEDDED
ncbi:MAG: VWA domain-containing protein, partial [Kangiellaceae bacterium]|nr:VWA domain-containing protein [Kangiellaceae bacterium]